MELTKEQIQKLFELAGMEIEYSIANSNDITKALVSLEDKLSCFDYVCEVKATDSKVLIVDDMELSTYQLSSLLKKFLHLSHCFAFIFSPPFLFIPP